MNTEDRRDPERGIRRRALRHFLEEEIWPRVPSEIRNQQPMTKAEREELLGHGPEGL
jgi:hypothetical protein